MSFSSIWSQAASLGNISYLLGRLRKLKKYLSNNIGAHTFSAPAWNSSAWEYTGDHFSLLESLIKVYRESKGERSCDEKVLDRFRKELKKNWMIQFKIFPIKVFPLYSIIDFNELLPTISNNTNFNFQYSEAKTLEYGSYSLNTNLDVEKIKFDF